MFRYSVVNFPLLPPPPPPQNLGCGGGESRCKSRKNKESPPWVCEKCAKKTPEEKRRGMYGGGIGCGYQSPDDLEAKMRAETSEATLDLGRTRHRIGCALHDAENETSEATLDLGRDGHSVGCMSRWPGAPDETSEATLDLGCDKCQKGKKRRKAAAEAFQNSMPSGWLNLQGGSMLRQVPIAGRLGTEYVYDETSEATLDLGRRAGMLGQVPLLGSDGGRGGKSVPYARNYQDETDEATLDLGRRGGLLGQVPLLGMGNGGRGGRSVPYNRDIQEREWYEGDYPYPPYGAYVAGSQPKKRCTGIHRYMGQSYSCPVSAAPTDPTLNCQRDARGNAVCSNGLHYPPGCPHTPPEEFFSPGIAPDEVHGGILEARIPAPRQAGTTGSSGVPASGAPAGAPGAAPSSGGTNIVPLAAGGIAIAGLLYAILR
jgi:hypothetical protein